MPKIKYETKNFRRDALETIRQAEDTEDMETDNLEKARSIVEDVLAQQPDI